MMKRNVLIFIASLVIVACGSSQKAISNTPIETTNEVLEEEVVEETAEEALEEVQETEEIITEIDTAVEEVEAQEEVVETVNYELVEAFDHTSFHNLLVANVSENGTVNYKGFIQNRKTLSEYIRSLGLNLPNDSWTKDDKLAYWMNAYNAMTIDLIIRNYPLKSIKDLSKPWDQRLWKLGDKWYNLNEIEHQILRKMDEPRIHFGINCASFSCPPLLNEAFTAAKVDSQLDKVAISFINDPQRNTISKMNIEISEIFSWFAKDFKKDGSLFDYLNKYSEIKIHPKARKKFMNYNWSLNE